MQVFRSDSPHIWESGGGKQRVADDQIGDNGAQGAVRLALVVVGETVELVVGDEFVERNGDAGGGFQMLGRELARDGIRTGVGRVEEVQGWRVCGRSPAVTCRSSASRSLASVCTMWQPKAAVSAV